jgi:hypothetical protein
VLIVTPDDGVALVNAFTDVPLQSKIMSWMTGLCAATFYEDPAQGAK